MTDLLDDSGARSQRTQELVRAGVRVHFEICRVFLLATRTLAAPVPSRLPAPAAPVQSSALRDGIVAIYGNPGKV